MFIGQYINLILTLISLMLINIDVV